MVDRSYLNNLQLILSNKKLSGVPSNITLYGDASSMSQLKLTADSGGGTVAIKGPASTTGNAALDLTVPGTASATLDTLKELVIFFK